MKVHRNSFYVLGFASCVALVAMLRLWNCQNLSIFYDICLGVFASALITAVSSLVCYFDQKQKIIVFDDILKVIFTFLCNFMAHFVKIFYIIY